MRNLLNSYATRRQDVQASFSCVSGLSQPGQVQLTTAPYLSPMKLTDIVSVSGMPGLYRMVASRDNGVIVEDFDTGKRTFASVRKYQFTPLETVGIYTYKDVVDLSEVFTAMDQSTDTMPDANAPAADLYAYFRKIVKDFDEDRVFLGDIKKVVKWYGFLKEHKVFEQSDEEE